MWIALCATVPLATGLRAQPIAITGVAVVSATEDTVRPGMTVVVADGRITAVGADGAVAVPEGSRRIDGEGRYLIPGLWDMHVHSSTDDNQRAIFLPLYIAHGITGVRDMNGDCLAPCGPLENPVDTLRAWTRDIRAGTLVGPRIVATSRIIQPPGPGESSTVQAPATEAHGRALARLLGRRGVDAIKVYDGVSREAFFGLLEEGRTLGLPVVGHLPLGVPATEAAAAGMRSMEHLFGIVDQCSSTEATQRPAVLEAHRTGDTDAVMRNLFDSFAHFDLEKCRSISRDLAASGAWFVPTLVVHAPPARLAELRRHPGMRFLPRDELEYWLRTLGAQATEVGGLAVWEYVAFRMALLTKDLRNAGAALLAGSDALAPGVFPGFGLHDELALLVDAGLTPAEALVAATLEPARYLAATDSMGSIGQGKVADLVLLDANPLEDIGNARRIHAVIARGRLFDRDALDTLLARSAAAARR